MNPNLGVDLYDLLTAGKDNYPSVAYQYAQALAPIDATERGLSYAFQRPDVFGGGAFGPVYQPWRDLRDALAAVLAETRTNLLGVAEVCCMAVKVYQETDDEAAAAFQSVLATRGMPEPTLHL
ncbi:hypothetical protein GCM10010168_12270 [Actinoplanes ianthinogenes]|uniref:Uncharacterized protein n=1 Tax=Actinoplanes ianthinogenes TaxID=122358 RepID=A0ABN6CH16_9ACTN|nr:hypothetical protein [Actinoplanes ianthinogenes]BCJ44413.1 hypothetical protein Aiant_50700 [Actinoplanes ianthinogenes]GGQ97859.1 hypothetical protein GCM10010168_12270 [Actinoplanes ianthinogenes]